MTKTILKFNDLSFREKSSEIEIVLLKNYSFTISRKDLENIGKFRIKDNSIEFKDINQKKAGAKFNFLISKNIAKLKNKLTGRKAIYIHKNSRIPLLGTLYFGIVDKGSDMIEVKPLTGCNIDCVFCSVGEGKSSKKEVDYVIEDDYIEDELKKLLEYKRKAQKNLKNPDMKIFINPHGEPLLYPKIIALVEKISRLNNVKTISIITNGTLLTEELIDKLKKAGLTQINLSINSLNPKKSQLLSGLNSYSIGHIKGVAEYASKKLNLVFAPVWIKGMNDEDIEEIIRFAKKLGCEIGIQKFIEHKTGKKPAKEISWKEFYKQIEDWENKHNINLRYCEKIIKTKELLMPFRRNDAVKAKVVCIGRKKNEVIVSAKQRCILIYNCSKKTGENIKIRIKTARHNVFTGEKIK